MTAKKILFEGCSFTASNGYTEANQHRFHWPYLLQQHYQFEFNNTAIGGSSNDEIFNRALHGTTDSLYKLVVVQWSEINRHWIYHATANIDDYTIINRGLPSGYRSKDQTVQQYAKLHHTCFNNTYVNLRRWLLQTIALAGFFEFREQNYIFIKGFENYISQFESIRYDVQDGFVGVLPEIKKLLDFDRRPDDYMLKKIVDIQKLIQQVKNLNWLNFGVPGISDAKFDLAEDKVHPGPDSNRALADQFINYCTQKKLLTHD